MDRTERPVGVIVAMEVELNTIRNAMEDPGHVRISGMDFYQGTVNGRPVVTARCGVGKVCAAICAQTMIREYAPQCILGAGIAGSLQGLPIGGVAVADALAQHDFDLVAFGYPLGYIPALKSEYCSTDRGMIDTLTELAEEMSVSYACGTIVSGDSFISSDTKKQQLIRSFPNAVACEMEGAAIAQVCCMNGIPFAVIRAISDNGDEDSKEDYPAHEAMAADVSARMVLAFIGRYRGE
nr:5'-methylthioadenosine/adenosylhomocysteine nucleosidase [Lachnospiraceae bacterium]